MLAFDLTINLKNLNLELDINGGTYEWGFGGLPPITLVRTSGVWGETPLTLARPSNDTRSP